MSRGSSALWDSSLQCVPVCVCRFEYLIDFEEGEKQLIHGNQSRV